MDGWMDDRMNVLHMEDYYATVEDLRFDMTLE